jgi:Tol biopolymer transport system component
MQHVWSRDGDRLAFLVPGDDSYVLVVTRAGGQAIAPYFAQPTEWGPDSKRLAVFLYDPTRSGTGPALLDVRTMHAQELGIYLSSELMWSPRGSFVAYTHDGYVFVERPNGTGRHRLIRGASASWSGDGKLLSFVRPRGRRWSAGYVITPDGRHVRRMPGSPTDWTWSPRGETYAFGRDVYDFVAMRRWRVLPRTLGVSKPIWSPDGRRLAYPGAETFFVVDRDGRHGHRVAWPRAARVSDPSWSPDGRTLAIMTEDGLLLVGVDGRHGRYVPLDLCAALAAQS